MPASRLKNRENGYIALISVIIIGLLLITISAALSFPTFYTRFDILDSEFKKASTGLAEACADLAILRLAEDFAYAVEPTADCSGGEMIKVGQSQCAICSVEASGANENTIKTQASTTFSVNKFSFTNLVVKVSTSTSDIQVLSWREVNKF